jgi:hypothetical protein
MNRPASGIVAVLCAAIITGCATREGLRESFREERERCVGETFMDDATWWCGWSDAIARKQIDEAREEYVIGRADMGKCRWIYTVERLTRRVTNWRYAGGEEDCYNRIDYLGPW